jgi:hypothetical protein
MLDNHDEGPHVEPYGTNAAVKSDKRAIAALYFVINQIDVINSAVLRWPGLWRKMVW